MESDALTNPGDTEETRQLVEADQAPAADDLETEVPGTEVPDMDVPETEVSAQESELSPEASGNNFAGDQDADEPESVSAEPAAEIVDANPGDISDINQLKRKMHFTGTVMKTTLAGAVVDIGLETPGVIHISQLQIEPVHRVEDVVHAGQQVNVWVRRVFPKKNRIELTMVEPLALEWREIEKDMVLKGKVTRIEKFGVFVDIGAERPGLVHISEMTHGYIKSPNELVKEGDEVEVKVLSVNRHKKQIKLSMKALEEKPVREVREAPAAAEKPKPEAVEVEKEAPIPTAMEIALREAMQRSQDKDETPAKGKKKPGQTNAEIEKILSRTLQNRNRK